MKGIILAAGRGSRMLEHTQESPKCLLKLGNKTLLDRQIGGMKENAIDEILVVCGYLSEKIKDSRIAVKKINERWKISNMVYSLMQADEYLSKSPCIVSYSDIFYSPKCISLLKNDLDDLTITYDPNFKTLWEKRFEKPLDDLESFEIDVDSYLTCIGEKCTVIDQIKGQYMGLLKITPSTWREIKELLKTLDQQRLYQLDMTSLLRMCMENNIRIKAVSIHNEAWGEVDHPADYKLYEEAFQNEILEGVLSE